MPRGARAALDLNLSLQENENALRPKQNLVEECEERQPDDLQIRYISVTLLGLLHGAGPYAGHATTASFFKCKTVFESFLGIDDMHAP